MINLQIKLLLKIKKKLIARACNSKRALHAVPVVHSVVRPMHSH